MKIIRLNRRYNMYDLGYTHALRWDLWDSKTCSRYESILGELYGWHGYSRTSHAQWYSGFGSRGNRGLNGPRRPYFIYVRNEAMITSVLLAV